MKDLALATTAPGDRARGAACIQVFREHFNFVYRCVRRHGARTADADDLVQEVFIAMWRRWADFDDSRPLRPWLAGIAFRVARCHVRRRPPEPVRIDGDDPRGPRPLDLPDPSQDRDQELEDDARALVLMALERLPERHRAPLVLHELDELSPAEIAALLKVPLSTVYTRVRRARLAFAKVITDLRRRGSEGRLAVLSPQALLAIERVPPPAPARAWKRAEEFARSVSQLRAFPPDPLANEGQLFGRRTGVGMAPLVVVAGAGILLAIVVLDRVAGPDQRHGRETLTIPSRAAPAVLAVQRVPRWNATKVPDVPTPGPDGETVALNKGLTGHWSFEEGPGAKVAHDQSGSGRPCRIRNYEAGASIKGVWGRALLLNGKAWLQCPQPAVLREDQVEMTVAAWVKRLSNRVPAAIATRQIGTGYEDQFFFGFKDDSLRIGGHAWTGWVSAPAPQAAERWFHTAFTHGRDGTTHLFLDGTEVGSNHGNPSGKGIINAPITIGAGRFSRRIDRVRQHFDGAIDDLLIYDRALSVQEVRALASGLRPSPGPHP